MKVRNIQDVPAQLMTRPDQEGLIVRNVINKDDAGARSMILLSSEMPFSSPGGSGTGYATTPSGRP